VFTFYKDLADQMLRQKSRLREYRQKVEECLIPKCPRVGCRKAFIDWEGCFAVYCTCGCSFCGHCLQDCGADAHDHVKTVHGSYYGTLEQFHRGFGVIATNAIRSVLAQTPAELKPLLEEAIPGILADNKFNIRPDQVVARQMIVGQHQDSPPIAQVLASLFSTAGHLYNRLTVANSEADPLPKILDDISSLVAKTQTLMFPDADSNSSSFTWIHAMLDTVCSAPVAAALNRAEIQETILTACRQAPISVDFLTAFDQKCRSHQTGVEQELQLSADKILTKIADDELKFDDNTQRCLLSLPRSVFNFKHQFWSHLEANYDVYPLLNLLHEYESSLHPKTTKRSFRIVQFLGQLQLSAREFNISETEASKDGSFFRLVNQVESLKSKVNEFTQDFVEAFEKINVWECNRNIQRDFEHMIHGIPDHTKLGCFLPNKKGLGILAMALWAGQEGDRAGAWVGLASVQNVLYNQLHPNIHPQEGSPFNLVESDVVQVDFQKVLQLVNSLFVVPGFQPSLASDLKIVELLCISGAPRLGSFPKLNPELPQFDYGLDGLGSLFSKLEERLTRMELSFTCLPASLANSVHSLIEQIPYASGMIFAFCGATLLQIEANPGAKLQEVFQLRSAVEMPLTEEQRHGQKLLMELPRARNSFLVQHLPAMMALCWSKKPDIHEKYDAPVDEKEEEAIEAGLQRFVTEVGLDGKIQKSRYHPQVSTFLSSLRVAGLVNFTSDNHPPCQLCWYLTLIEVPAQEDFESEPPFTTETAHFGTVLRIAERIFGPVELESDAPNSARECISFASIRPVLQSLDVQEAKLPEHAEQFEVKEEKTTEDRTPSSADEVVRRDPNPEVTVPLLWADSTADLDF